MALFLPAHRLYFLAPLGAYGSYGAGGGSSYGGGGGGGYGADRSTGEGPGHQLCVLHHCCFL